MTVQLSSEERTLLVDSLRRLLEEGWPVEGGLERAQDSAAMKALSSMLCELGLTSLGAAEGPGTAESLLVFEELGRAAAPAPLIGAVIANLLLDGSDDEAVQAFVAQVQAGEAVPAVALGAFDGDRSAGSASCEAGRLEASLRFVEDMDVATHLIVLVGEPAGLAIIPVDGAGVSMSADPGLAVPSLSAVDIAAAPLFWQPLEQAKLAEAAQLIRLLCLARAYGAAQRAFDLAIEHAKVRRQFGHVIGEFQAIQHKLVNCFSHLDATKLLLSSAGAAHDRGDKGWVVLADAALGYTGPALRQVALEVHHTLGAIGYAEEHEAPRHFRRVHADLLRFGGTARARANLADHLLHTAALPSHDLDESVIAFRQSIRAWLAENWTDADREANRQRPLRDRRWNPEFSRRMGEAGWLGLDWPAHVGGQARSPGEQLAFIEELEFAEAPTDAHMTAETIIGPAIINFGSDEQKSTFLSAFLKGERPFALHYSEPEAGSDLASLRTTARRDGDDWIISGQKLWSTYGDRAEYAILAARTNPDARPKHAGISVFLMPLDTRGISIRPSMAMYGRTFSATFYDDVRVPAGALLGPENGGWKVITSALAAERVMIGNTVSHLQHIFGKLVSHVRDAGDGPGALRNDPVIRDRIGALGADLEAARQFTLRNANLVQAGKTPIYEAAMSKVFVGELQERLCEAALDILGTGGLLSDTAPSAPLGEMEQELRHSLMGVLGGGTSEIQRNIIALRGLGLPRMSS